MEILVRLYKTLGGSLHENPVTEILVAGYGNNDCWPPQQQSVRRGESMHVS
jgi:hypothetical protein